MLGCPCTAPKAGVAKLALPDHLNSPPCRLSLIWSISESGTLPLASVEFWIRPQFSKEKHLNKIFPRAKHSGGVQASVWICRVLTVHISFIFFSSAPSYYFSAITCFFFSQWMFLVFFFFFFPSSKIFPFSGTNLIVVQKLPRCIWLLYLLQMETRILTHIWQ